MDEAETSVNCFLKKVDKIMEPVFGKNNMKSGSVESVMFCLGQNG